jgi:hypothetical protein
MKFFKIKKKVKLKKRKNYNNNHNNHNNMWKMTKKLDIVVVVRRAEQCSHACLPPSFCPLRHTLLCVSIY